MHVPNALRLRRALALALATFATLTSLALAQNPAPEAAAPAPAPALTVPDEAASYSVGLVFGSQLHGAGVGKSISVDAVVRGLKEGLAGKAMSPEDKERTVALMRAGRETLGARNRELAAAFLAKNTAAPGITTTASGLQYEVLSPGDAKAASATATDRVTVHYRGRLLDGTEFDNSDAHAQAATFSLNGGVIKGWREALLLMKPGAKWRLFVPPALAYDLNSPPSIPPGSLLIFDVELVKVEPPQVMSVQPPKAPKAAKPAAGKPPAKAGGNP